MLSRLNVKSLDNKTGQSMPERMHNEVSSLLDTCVAIFEGRGWEVMLSRLGILILKLLVMGVLTKCPGYSMCIRGRLVSICVFRRGGPLSRSSMGSPR